MPKNKDKNLLHEVYQTLLKKIITLEIQPGEILNEKALLSELGVSRTPFRAAIALLKQESLVGGEPNKSSYVKDLSLKDFRNLVESLIIVEKNTSCLAAERATEEELAAIENAGKAVDRAIEQNDFWGLTSHNFDFHRTISKASRNDYLYRFHQTLRHQAERFSFLAVSREINDETPSLNQHNTLISQQHNELVKALKKRDVDLVEALSAKHVTLFQNRVFRLYKKISYR